MVVRDIREDIAEALLKYPLDILIPWGFSDVEIDWNGLIEYGRRLVPSAYEFVVQQAKKTSFRKTRCQLRNAGDRVCYRAIESKLPHVTRGRSASLRGEISRIGQERVRATRLEAGAKCSWFGTSHVSRKAQTLIVSLHRKNRHDLSARRIDFTRSYAVNSNA
jgi:hypothetical protein